MDISFKYYKTSPLIITTLILAGMIDYTLKWVLIPLLSYFHLKPEILRAPGNAAIILLIFWLYDNFLWKCPILNNLVKLPTMAGRYEGKIEYIFNNIPGAKDCVIEIFQTASIIKVHSYFNNSIGEKTSSKSLIENIIEEDGFFHIYLFYLNSGLVGNSTLDCHEGANHLKFINGDEEQPRKLIGHYFTNRNIQTRGTIEVKYVSEKLKGEF